MSGTDVAMSGTDVAYAGAVGKRQSQGSYRCASRYAPREINCRALVPGTNCTGIAFDFRGML
eukprot:2529635-Rhodomonas_salina.1